MWVIAGGGVVFGIVWSVILLREKARMVRVRLSRHGPKERERRAVTEMDGIELGKEVVK